MKKNGFTITETLIVLAVIGIIAMLTMPTYIANQRKKMYAKTLQVAVVNFQTAMTNLISKEGVDDLLETTAWNADKAEFFVANIGKVLGVLRFNNDPSSYLPLAGTGDKIPINNTINITTKNGVEYKINKKTEGNVKKSEEETLMNNLNYTNKAATVYIDINGKVAPNIVGRDLFEFDLAVNGLLYPVGSADYNYYNNETSDPETKCVKNLDGKYCAAYLMNNGYNMDY